VPYSQRWRDSAALVIALVSLGISLLLAGIKVWETFLAASRFFADFQWLTTRTQTLNSVYSSQSQTLAHALTAFARSGVAPRMVKSRTPVNGSCQCSSSQPRCRDRSMFLSALT
jgi:hypothetical protein